MTTEEFLAELKKRDDSNRDRTQEDNLGNAIFGFLVLIAIAVWFVGGDYEMIWSSDKNGIMTSGTVTGYWTSNGCEQAALEATKSGIWASCAKGAWERLGR